MFCKYEPSSTNIKRPKQQSSPELPVGGRSLCDNRCWRRQRGVELVIAQVKGERTWTHNGWSGGRARNRLRENLLFNGTIYFLLIEVIFLLLTITRQL